jgi:hypothetical protein
MDSNHKSKALQIKKQKNLLLNNQANISLTTILNSGRCQEILSGCREFRDRVYTPLRTLFTFIKQVLNPDKSCKKAVAGVVVEELNKGIKISSNTGPYCKARQRLSEEAIQDLVKEVGQSPTKKAPLKWKPYGRELKALDGSTNKMADTEANQSVYPQHKKQKKGAGFPILRYVAVMSLTVGTVLNYAIGAYKGKGTGETALFREIFDCIEEDDIVLGDAYFPNFFVISDLILKKADGIFRAQGQRNYDFRKGERLGKNDHIVCWKRPQRPEWMDEETYAAYPNEIRVREFKVAGKIYVTTLLQAKKYNKKELAQIYQRRWEVEINLKSIKDIMNMDMLTCKTPEMVRKEIGVHFLAYNFIRVIMAEACEKYDSLPWQISFKGTVQLVNEFTPYFLTSNERENRGLYAELLRLIVKNKVGNRPGRVEPRVIKQRQKPFPKLKRARSIEKARLMKKIEKMIIRNAAA